MTENGSGNGKAKDGTNRGAKSKILRELPDNGKTVFASVVDDLRVGGYIADAAHRAGVSPASVFRWIARGAEWEDHDEEKDGPIPEHERVYVEFCVAVERARSDAVMASLAVIRRAAQGTPAEYSPDGNLVRKERQPEWTAAAWYLERTRPHEFGRQIHEHQGKDGAPLTLTELEAAVDAEDASD